MNALAGGDVWRCPRVIEPPHRVTENSRCIDDGLGLDFKFTLCQLVLRNHAGPRGRIF